MYDTHEITEAIRFGGHLCLQDNTYLDWKRSSGWLHATTFFTLRRLHTNVKGKDKPEDRPEAVYKIHCSDCQATYIGETRGNLTTRLSEHKQATKKGDLNNKIAKHHLKTSHTITWDSATCLTYSTDYSQRTTVQSWLEQRTNCPQSLSTSSRTLQTFTQQETVTPCLLFILQPIYVFTANHITHLVTATLSTDQSNHSPGFLNFQLTNTTTWFWRWLPHRLSKRLLSLTTVLPSQDSNHPDDLFQSRYLTPGFKPFS